MKRYAVSDIHGCSITFRHMTEKLLKLQPGDKFYILGDHIDRGPGSKDVIDHIFELKQGGVNVHALKGNHEDMFLKALEQPAISLDHWLDNGGKATLKSFDLYSYESMSTLSRYSFDQKYMDFFNDLEYYIETEDYYLVHAGFNFASPDPLADRYSMLWVRNSEVDEKFLGKRKLIHGHTPRTLLRIEESLTTKVIDIDGGCVYKGSPTGHLVALDLDSLHLTWTPCLD